MKRYANNRSDIIAACSWLIGSCAIVPALIITVSAGPRKRVSLQHSLGILFSTQGSRSLFFTNHFMFMLQFVVWTRKHMEDRCSWKSHDENTTQYAAKGNNLARYTVWYHVTVANCRHGYDSPPIGSGNAAKAVGPSVLAFCEFFLCQMYERWE